MKLDLVKNTISWEIEGEEMMKGIQLYNIFELMYYHKPIILLFGDIVKSRILKINPFFMWYKLIENSLFQLLS